MSTRQSGRRPSCCCSNRSRPPTCLSRDTGVRGGTPGLSTTVYFTIPLTPPMPEGISTFPNTLALPPMPTAWLSPGMTRGLRPNLWKRASSAFRNGRVSMTPLCAAVSASDSPGSTSIPVKVAASSSASTKGVDQPIHIHCLEERMIRPLLLSTILTALVCLVPSACLPVARTPAARFPVAESICWHRDHSSRHQSMYHDSHTCPRNCSSFGMLLSQGRTGVITQRSHYRFALLLDRAMTHQSHSPFALFPKPPHA